jgi:diguanylate cyclase (GGDEF)-like protein
MTLPHPLRRFMCAIESATLAVALARPSRSLWILRGIGFVLALLILVGGGVAVLDLYRREIAEAKVEMRDLGIVLAAQTSGQIRLIELFFQAVQSRGQDLGIRTPEGFRLRLGDEDTHRFLSERTRSLPQVNAISLFDADGALVNTSRDPAPPPPVNVSNRDYFLHARDFPEDGVFVGVPAVSPGSGLMSCFLSRRISGPDGSFLGVMVVSVNIEYLLDFYRSLSQERGISVTLLRRDGVVLTRYPTIAVNGQNMPGTSEWHTWVAAGGGTYRSPGYFSGVTSIVSVTPLGDFPLVVNVSVHEENVFESWWRPAAMVTGGSVLLAIMLVTLIWMITRQIHRQESQNTALRAAADARRSSERAAEEKSYLLETTLNHMDQGLVMIAADDTVAVCNRRAMELLDLPAELMCRQPRWSDVLKHQWEASEFVRTDATLQEFIRRSALLDGPLVYDRERPNGTFLEVRTTPLPDGKAVRTYTDITERKQAEQRVDFLAHHDAMTGLPNRVLLNDRLSQALARTTRSGSPVAVLTLDLDRFKEINDTYGHDVGDHVLVQAADRLRGAVRAADTVARIGGDEFVVIQCDAPQPEAAVELAQRLVEALSRPFDVGNQLAAIGGSVGIALLPGDGDTAADLLKNSDIALYRAKADGRGTFRLFEPEMDLEIRERRSIEQDLRLAIGTDQLKVHFQPQFASDTKMITGFEALLRWEHPVRGSISPAVMIPIAEASQLILDLGAWVLEAACDAAMTWSVPHRVAVNLSAAQFRAGDLPTLVESVLLRTGLPACRLELEVTESLLIDSADLALAALRSLKRMGVSIALDDFGTGYSSLSYLRLFPFNKIKIDKSFIHGLGEDPCALSIIDAILAMGRSLDMDVIAEGIETEQQLTILCRHHCSEVQGYLLGRPMPSDSVREYLDKAALAKHRATAPEPVPT